MSKKQTKQKLIAIFGGAGISLFLVIIIAGLCFCWRRFKRKMNRTFDAESSFQSTSADWHRVVPKNAVSLSTLDSNNLLHFRLSDLEHATANFSESSVIGEGEFGKVYKGLLTDGTIVSIKRRFRLPIQSLSHMVKSNACIRHKHLLKLVGLGQESHQQFLVYDYLLNQDVGKHLYDDEGVPIGKLDMNQRLLIAIGAAKGLEHLHSFRPPILHMHFRTSNVLIDENFTAKVSDFGTFGLLVEEGYAFPSRSTDCFLDPELKSYKVFSSESDVYSFGVFLLEMISGRKAIPENQSKAEQSLVSQAKNVRHIADFVDKKLRHNRSSSQAVKLLFDLAMLCIDTNITRRPSMKTVVHELEMIHRAIKSCCASNQEMANVTLGSVLFES